MSRSRQEETNKMSFTIFGSIYIFLWFLQTQTHISTTRIVISFYHCSSSSCPRTDPRRARRGGRRCSESGPERGRGRAQGVFQATAKLIDNGTGGEERLRDDERRRRAEGCANGPAGRGRRPGEEGNRAREGRRCSSRKESRSSSPETANRRRPTELLAAASMAAGRRGLDSGRENAGASSRRLVEVEGEVRGPDRKSVV